MAKLSLNKLNLKKQAFEKELVINEQVITIKQYLPVEEKFNLIATIAADAVDNPNYFNPARFETFFKIRVLLAYTNITLTPSQQKDIGTTFDLLEENKIFTQIFKIIPTDELEIIHKDSKELLQNVYTYQHSVMGIMERIGTDYSEVGQETNEISEKLSNPNNLKLVKDILTKLG